MPLQIKCRTILFLFLAGGLLYLPGFAQSTRVAQIDTIADSYNLLPYLDVLEDPQGELTINEASSLTIEADYVPYLTNGTKNISINPNHVYWVKFRIQNKLHPGFFEGWKLYIGRSDYVTVFYADQQGQFSTFKTGDLVPVQEEVLKTGVHLNRVPYPLQTTDETTVYIRYESVKQYPPVFDVSLERNEKFETWSSNTRRIWEGIFLGFLFTMAIFSIVMALATRDNAFLFHGFYLLGIAVFLFDAHKILHNIALVKTYPLIKNHINYISLSLMDLAYLQFLRSYMNLKSTSPRWHRRLGGLMIARAAILVFLILFYFFTINEVFSDQIFALSLILEYYILIAGFLWYLFKLKNRAANYLIAGTLLIMITVGINAFLVITTGQINMMSIYLGLFGEIVLFTYGLGYRFINFQRELSKQKIEHEQRINKHLRRVDSLKDQFLANTSHELRTPLHGIIGLSESLYEEVEQEKQKKNLAMIIASGKRLSNLVNDILDFSKLRTREIELTLKPIDLRLITEVVFKISEPLVKGKDLKLLNEVDAELPPVLADENRLQQILLNLVGNAIKFTHHGSVKVYAQAVGSKIEISVEDTGIGIPEDKLDQIFEFFEHTESLPEGDYTGSGLGLTISRQLVELHGGRIRAISPANKETGTGSAFIFTLLKADGIALPANTEALTMLRTYEIPEIENTLPDQPAVLPAEEDNHKYNILIVDDDPVNQQVLSNYLSEEHFLLTHVLNGPDALKQIEDGKKFDVVLLDIMMPGMSGYEVCKRIRETYPPNELPILMVTAKNQVSDLVQALTYKANDYLVKPISKKELLARLGTHINLLHINKSYSRFVPKEFFKVLGKDNVLDVKLGDQVEQEVTVLFADIRSYTTLSESMTVKENFKFLNAYLKRIVPIINGHNGLVHQFLGDGIMALFLKDPEDAIKASIAYLRMITTYNQHRIEKDRVPLKIGIGMHTGSLMLGIIGDEDRMGAGVVSDTVNTASRMEGLTKHFNVSLLASEDVFRKLKEPEQFNYRYIGKVQVKGKKKALEIYEFFDGESEEMIALKKQTKADFDLGLQKYYSKDFEEALIKFKKVIEINPDDYTARFYQKKSGALIAQGVADNWTGIEVMLNK